MSEAKPSEILGSSESRAARILALDTSTRTASVAVLGGAREVEIDHAVGSHSDDLIALIDRALADAGLRLAELDAVAVGAGPGSFTGLRIAMATGKGLCFASGLPLWPVSSLAALALDGVDNLAAADPPEDAAGALFVPLLDARRDEVFVGLYRAEGAGVIAIAPDAVLPVAELARAVADALSRTGSSRAILLGDAQDNHATALAAAGELVTGARSTPSARSIGRLAALGEHADALRSGTPVYIRPSEAEVKFPDGNPGGHPHRSGKQ
jgi:tRNA threonylcarbamoyladenosine biosynthesis protein TsaB